MCFKPIENRNGHNRYPMSRGTLSYYEVEEVCYCGVTRVLVRPGRRASRRSLRAFVGCLGGFWLARCPVSDCTSRSAARYVLDFPQSSPSFPTGHSTASPTPEYSTTVFQVHRGGSNPMSLSSRPDVRGTPSISPGSCLVYLSVSSLIDPTLAGTPRSGASDGSSLVCLHRESH